MKRSFVSISCSQMLLFSHFWWNQMHLSLCLSTSLTTPEMYRIWNQSSHLAFWKTFVNALKNKLKSYIKFVNSSRELHFVLLTALFSNPSGYRFIKQTGFPKKSVTSLKTFTSIRRKYQMSQRGFRFKVWFDVNCKGQ